MGLLFLKFLHSHCATLRVPYVYILYIYDKICCYLLLWYTPAVRFKYCWKRWEVVWFMDIFVCAALKAMQKKQVFPAFITVTFVVWARISDQTIGKRAQCIYSYSDIDIRIYSPVKSSPAQCCILHCVAADYDSLALLSIAWQCNTWKSLSKYIFGSPSWNLSHSLPSLRCISLDYAESCCITFSFKHQFVFRSSY